MFVDIHTHNKNCVEGCVAIYSVMLPLEGCVPHFLGGNLLSAGQHPWCSEGDFTSELLSMADDIVAVGEIGVDKLHPNFERQQQLFEKQILIAIELQKPIIIHSVRSFEQSAAAIKRYRDRLRGVVIHSFVGGVSQMEYYLKLGCYISISPHSLRSKVTCKALESLPVDRMFIESDNSLSSISSLYKLVSERLNIPLLELETALFKNFRTLFSQ